MPRPQSHARFAIIDVETTGLSPWRHDRIVEIAVVLMTSDGVIESEYETLVNPERDMGPSRIHRISAGEVLHAPRFADIAGDVIEFMRGANVVAGHNVSFDRNFVVKEFDRLGIVLPAFECICTCQLLGRNSLENCCQEFGLTFDGEPHCALHDARMTAKLLHRLIEDDPIVVEKHYQSPAISWPALPRTGVPPITRRLAGESMARPPSFLQRISAKGRHDCEATSSAVVAYLTLLDRVLEDRRIEDHEADALVDAAEKWGISESQVVGAHRSYICGLAVNALADGIVTEAERADLNQVARLLGQDETELEGVLATASKQLQAVSASGTTNVKDEGLTGKTVCFTGELLSRLGGEPISRNVAESLAEKAGLVVASSVTKKLDLLVVADPNTQSGKAKKARQYGVRVLADAVFWRMIGVDVM